MPFIKSRTGGKFSYAEWAHVIGVFQTILFKEVNRSKDTQILDFGCGTGLVGIAVQPSLIGNRKYTGIDVSQKSINHCRSWFKDQPMEFIHLNSFNALYSGNQPQELVNWPIASTSQDLIIGLSVWTHLAPIDFRFYLSEVVRVMKADGRTMITLFYLDEAYKDSLFKRENTQGRFHSTNQLKWIFDQPVDEEGGWFTPSWTKCPEQAIAITEEKFDKELAEVGLKLVEYYPGNWKEIPGVYFQDILILEKE
ncbi:MAG: class I SAM-dependent methyltransferase [Cytophagia bacterium]|nr:class I SAM-dependent methyltransferase [Cytophagia bacterium]